MFLSDMQQKDIVDLETGDNLGKLTDVEIDLDGKIKSFTAEPKRFFKRLFKSQESIINYENIVKIGSDVILVKTIREKIKE